MGTRGVQRSGATFLSHSFVMYVVTYAYLELKFFIAMPK